ncbi:hypothetical protein SKAU_G00307880 [Synaphobranchus kaupii]|uniref:Uncharacterized protein n=1 Tax=Synaphobranchus kaupii TaxID=118154 RepID=A0A9Q1EQY4_SYNKA|nr:hypothetical protein SKAU_G00307880 [Synaphobranchus kaupii]
MRKLSHPGGMGRGGRELTRNKSHNVLGGPAGAPARTGEVNGRQREIADLRDRPLVTPGFRSGVKRSLPCLLTEPSLIDRLTGNMLQ